MMQTQWPDAGRTFEPERPATWTGPVGRPSGSADVAAPSSAAGDGLSRPWWTTSNGTTGFGGFGGFGAGDAASGSLFGASGSLFGASGALFAAIGGIISQLQALAGSYLNGGRAPGNAQQNFSSLDVSSTGDPHLAAVGTRAGGCDPNVNDRFDSMTGHADLVDSSDIAGGYRVSTAVTQPDAGGITWNRSATVYANDGWDAVTMNRDGSVAICSDGNSVQLDAGRSVRLAGGETVTRNADGSLTVEAMGMNGGTIATTMRASGRGVDVTTHARNIAVGGDVVNHADAASRVHGYGRPQRRVQAGAEHLHII